MQQESNSSGTGLIVTAILTGLTLLVALTMRDQMAAIYHRSQFDKAYAEQIRIRQSDPRPGFVFIQAVQDIESDAWYNLNRLHELGAIAKLDLSLPNIPSDSLLRRSLLDQLVTGDCPSNLTWQSVEAGDSSPMVLTVWCDHNDVNHWKAFARNEDLKATKIDQNHRMRRRTGR